MKLLIAFTLTLLYYAIVIAASEDSMMEALFNDILSQYSSTRSGDLRKMPPAMLHRFLRNSLPKMKEHLVEYSMAMNSPEKSKKKAKPNPVLMGFSVGLKVWGNFFSQVVPLLSKFITEEEEMDDPCYYEDDVCYEDGDYLEHIHPCCHDNVSCPLFPWAFL